jgi:hypothetical protein
MKDRPPFDSLASALLNHVRDRISQGSDRGIAYRRAGLRKKEKSIETITYGRNRMPRVDNGKK